MKVKKTHRKPGRISGKEVERFQRRYGLEQDRKFGNQCFGQLMVIEAALYDQPKRPAVFSGASFVMGALVAYIVFMILSAAF
jgi:hypothetical protein